MKLVRWDDRIAILQKNSIAIFAFRFDVDDFLIVNILVFQIFDEAQPRNCDYWAEERNSGTWDHNRLDLKLSSVSSIRSICKINACTLETICKLQELFSPKMTELHLLVHKKSNVEYTSWHNSFSKLNETRTITKLMLSWESTCKRAIPFPDSICFSPETNYNPMQKELRRCVYIRGFFSLGHLCFLFPSPRLFQCCHGRKIYWKILHTQHWKGGGGNRQDSMQFYWKRGINPRL